MRPREKCYVVFTPRAAHLRAVLSKDRFYSYQEIIDDLNRVDPNGVRVLGVQGVTGPRTPIFESIFIGPQTDDLDVPPLLISDDNGNNYRAQDVKLVGELITLPVVTEQAPTTFEDLVVSSNVRLEERAVEEKKDYDSGASKVAWKGFESTTGQEVDSEKEGEIKASNLTLRQMALKEDIASNPAVFRYFVVKATPEFEGHEMLGEGLLAIPVDEVPSEITTSSLASVARYPLLPLQGTSPFELQEGVDDTFFTRNHTERLQIAADKKGITVEQAEAEFREGQRKMRNVRERASKNPVEVGVKEVTQGSLAEQKDNPRDLLKDYEDNRIVKKLVSGSKNIFKIFVTTGVGDIPLTQREIRDVLGDERLTDLFTKAQAGNLSDLEILLLNDIFHNQQRQGKVNFTKGNFFFGREPISSPDQFLNLLNFSPFAKVHDKINDQTRDYYIVKDGQIQPVSWDDFIKTFMRLEGDLWRFRGVEIPYRANRVVYLDLNPFVESQPGALSMLPDGKPRNNFEALIPVINEISEDYELIATSDDPRHILLRQLVPSLFSDRFLKTQSYRAIKAGAKAVYDPLIGIRFMFNDGTPTDAITVRSMTDFQEIIGTYEERDKNEITKAFNRAVEDEIQRYAGISPEGEESVKIRIANTILKLTETGEVFGENVFSIRPSMNPDFYLGQDISNMNGSYTSFSATSGGAYSISPELYRYIQRSMGLWSNEDETMYDNDGSTSEKSVSYSIKGQPVFFKIDPTLKSRTGYEVSFRETLNLTDIQWIDKTIDPPDTHLEILKGLPIIRVSVDMTSGGGINREVDILGNVLANAVNIKYPNDYIPTPLLIDMRAKTPGTPFEAKLPISDKSKDAIKQGSKTMTVRQTRFGNQQGIKIIDGDFYSIDSLGELSMSDINGIGITLNDFIQRVTGDATATTESITQEDLRDFFDDGSKRHIYRISKLGDGTGQSNIQGSTNRNTETISCSL